MRLSEIMYHPIVDDADESTYEFIEIHNGAQAAIPLGGWKIEGGAEYAFAAGASIQSGQYLVVAKSRKQAAETYALAAANVIGDYAGDLDNGGALVLLRDAAGDVADCVKYDDKAPWPIAPDALGAKPDWFAPDDRRSTLLANNAYRGVSLERISFDVPGTEVSNWEASSLDGPTPGRPNTSAGTPRPIAIDVSATSKAGAGLIHNSDEVVIRARFSTLGALHDVQLESFVDDPQKTGEPPQPLLAMAAVQDAYEVTLPKQKDNAIVRYRVLADRGSGRERVSPRPSDPNAWHAYFVAPPTTSKTPTYHLFISSDDWGKMWTDAGGLASNTGLERYIMGRQTTGPMGTEESGCTIRPEFDGEVPAVFVENGVVSDVLVRYQGSRWNRLRGEQLKTWPYPGPSKGPKVPLIQSWYVVFPSYRPFETVFRTSGPFDPAPGDIKIKRTNVNIKKANYQICPSFPNYVANQVMASVGLASARVKLVRFQVNGGYYGYMADQGPTDELVARAFEPPDTKLVGDLFKTKGDDPDGPYTWADASPLLENPKCVGVFPLWQRYQLNYERKTYGWKERAISKNPLHPPDLVQSLIEGLEQARQKDLARGATTTENRKKFLDQNFDLPQLRDYIVVRNWAGAWDDNEHNYYLYKKSSDGKWVIIGWDFDLEYGGVWASGERSMAASASFFNGEEGNPENKFKDATTHLWNAIKDAYLKSYRPEFAARMRELSADGQILSPSVFNKVVDDLMNNAVSMADWNEVPVATPQADRYPTNKVCAPTAYAQGMKDWARDRRVQVFKQLPPPP